MNKLKNLELVAYDNMGMAYYYMNDLKSASYYHNRMTDNVIEPCDSQQVLYCISNENLIKNQVLTSTLSQTKVGFNEYYILAANTIEERNSLVYRQFQVSTEKNETPRILRYEPIKSINSADLPSPRRIELASSTFTDSLAKKTSYEDKMKNRKLAFMLRIRTKMKSKVPPIENLILSPKIYLSHLSYGRGNSNRSSEDVIYNIIK